jgi:hypothetical protein
MGKKLTASVALVLQDHLNRDRGGKPAKAVKKAKASKAAKSKKKAAGKGKAKAQ